VSDRESEAGRETVSDKETERERGSSVTVSDRERERGREGVLRQRQTERGSTKTV
jgi:hypothetical protein